MNPKGSPQRYKNIFAIQMQACNTVFDFCYSSLIFSSAVFDDLVLLDSEDEVGVLVDEGDDFVVVLGLLVVGAVALEDVAVGEG